MQLTEWQNGKIYEYCADNMKKLKKICTPIIRRKGVEQQYNDDLYSIAMQTLIESVSSFKEDNDCSFNTYLVGNINRAFYDWTRDSRRVKRCNLQMDSKGKIMKDENGSPIIIPNVSIDTSNEDGIDIIEKIGSKVYLEDIISGNDKYSEKTEMYLNNLPEIARKIITMIAEGFTKEEIKEEIGINNKQYREHWNTISSYENKRILYKNNDLEDEGMNSLGVVENIAESYKNTSYSISSISKQMQKKRIRDDHILQRHSGQWAKFAKSELVADILRGKSLTQIIISEEIKNSLKMQWLIDGKQRCTTLDDFFHDGFAISRNIKSYLIQYQVVRFDENGNELLNEEGFPEVDTKEFDIRGKKYSQLPEELQDIFKDRQIPVLYNMNCTKKDIADDIARFNRSRSMNTAQSGWLGLEEQFAELVDNIAKMPFFQVGFKGSDYTEKNHTSGGIRKTIVEAIMLSNFFVDYNKQFNKNCEYLTEEASDSNFTEFYSFIERLTVVSNEKVKHLFNLKDSFLWFCMFERFNGLHIEDAAFIQFMEEFEKNLQFKKVDGITYDELINRKIEGKKGSTKDKNIVETKINHIETLMNEYFGINEVKGEEEVEAINPESTLDFLQKNVSDDIKEMDMEFYEEMLDDLTVEVNNNTELLEPENNKSLLAIVAYSVFEDFDLDQWLPDFFIRHSTYIKNQKENYLYMKEDIGKYFKRDKMKSA